MQTHSFLPYAHTRLVAFLTHAQLEVLAESVDILNVVTRSLPFPISEAEEQEPPKEDTRLKNRVLDLRCVYMCACVCACVCMCVCVCACVRVLNTKRTDQSRVRLCVYVCVM